MQVDSCTDHRATVLERQGLGHGRVPDGLGFAERVAEDEQLAQAGDEGHLGRLAGRDEALVAGAQRGVDAGGRQGGHGERGADLGAPAPTTPPPRVRAIGGPVIRHHRPHHDALRAEPGERAVQEGQGIALAVTGPHLGIGQARVVVDGHVHVLPAGAGAAGHPIAG